MNTLIPVVELGDEQSVKTLNERNPHPSKDMIKPASGKRYSCDWIKDSMTLHCDGNISCGLDDPHQLRSFGDLGKENVLQVFQNSEYEKLLSNFDKGFVCSRCNLYHEASEMETVYKRKKYPRTLIVESTVKCNLRCPNDACIPNNDSNVKTRESPMLSLDVFMRVISELGGHLEFMYFLNYGDPFIHRKAEDMLLFAKNVNPNLNIVTSTNGIPLAKRERAVKLVSSGLDHITFTIGGVYQDGYEKYHVNGSVDYALNGMRNVCEEKSRLNLVKPFVTWRYLLFSWNDSDQEINEAKRLAAEMGVDQLSFYLTDIPLGAGSYRLSPGSPHFDSIRSQVSAVEGYQNCYPDENGFYCEEVDPAVGPMRWTAWRARILSTQGKRWITFSITTNWEDVPNKKMRCFVKTPWGTYSINVNLQSWVDIIIPVPRTYRNKHYVTEIYPENYWYPAKELNSSDLRCLGVMFRGECSRDNANAIVKFVYFKKNLLPISNDIKRWIPNVKQQWCSGNGAFGERTSGRFIGFELE